MSGEERQPRDRQRSFDRGGDAKGALGGAAIRASQTLGRTGAIAGQRVVQATSKGSDRAVAALTQRDNWASVELYLAQVVEVLAAHEAEILTLRRQVEALTAQLSDEQ